MSSGCGEGVLADDHHRAAVVGGELAQQPGDLAADGGVEVGGGLVGQDDRRIVGERAGDRHPLLLAAGELLGPEAEPVAQPDAFQQGTGALVGGVAGGAGEVAGQLDVLGDGERRQQVEVLEDEAEAAGAQARQAPLGGAGDVQAVHLDDAGGGAQHGAEHQQQGGLAAAGRAHEQHHLAGVDVQVDAADGGHGQLPLPEGLGEPGDVEGRVAAGGDRHGLGGHVGLRNEAAGSTRSTRRMGRTAPATPTSSAPKPVRSTLAGEIQMAMAGLTRPSSTASSSARMVAAARANSTDQAAWAATVAASRPGLAPSALTTPYSRVLATVTVNRVRAITASAIPNPMPDMMRIRSALMSVTMRRSEAANWLLVCTVLPGGIPSNRARSRPRSTPRPAPTST